MSRWMDSLRFVSYPSACTSVVASFLVKTTLQPADSQTFFPLSYTLRTGRNVATGQTYVCVYVNIQDVSTHPPVSMEKYVCNRDQLPSPRPRPTPTHGPI